MKRSRARASRVVVALVTVRAPGRSAAPSVSSRALMTLRDVLASHRVVVCVGSGGVGKTTTAASLALHAAIEGRRVLCMTIDPAKRLANSLGLSHMTSEEQVVPASVFAEHGLELAGSLSAMMLDTKRTFDELVRRTASSPERAERIIGNKLYKYISTSLAGTQEYMAMEKLHAVKSDPRYDLVVLDTPPTSNALDFLDAPERLAGLIDSPAMRWFVQAFEGAGKLSLNLVGKGAAFLLRNLSRFTGTGFLEEVAEFVTEFNDLFGGFRERAEQVSSYFRSSEVAFVVVTSPAPLAIEEAIYFGGRLAEAGMRRDAFVINQVHPLIAEPSVTTSQLEAEARAVLPVGADASKLVARMRRALDDARLRAVADRLEADRLENQCGKDTVYVEVPVLEHDVHDVGSLAKVASYLVGESVHERVQR
jgi:anion-transporting  ArsA/GET3 family ATPase